MTASVFSICLPLEETMTCFEKLTQAKIFISFEKNIPRFKQEIYSIISRKNNFFYTIFLMKKTHQALLRCKTVLHFIVSDFSCL